MATELTLDTLAEMKKADFVKAFKERKVWKKAKAVIVLVDYKLDGKRTAVAVPYRKVAEMKKEMKRLKEEKIHDFKKSGGGLISFEDGDDGKAVAKIELQKGGLKGELLEQKGEKLFKLLKVGVNAIAEAAAELVEKVVDAIIPDEPENERPLEPVKQLMKGIADDFKNKIKGIVIPAVKNQVATQENLDTTEELASKLDDLESMLEDLSDELRQKVDEHAQRILGLAPTLEKIKSKLIDFLGIEEEPDEELNEAEIIEGLNLIENYDPVEDLNEDQLALEEEEAQPVNETDSEIERLLNVAQQDLDHTQAQEVQLQADMEEMAAVNVPSGEELLNALT